MVDALMPGKDGLAEALSQGADFADALRRSAAAAEEGMRATVPLVARKGRASYLGERSAGHQDPGATSTYLLLKTAADIWAD
jgi:dihydroxyacetone kinase-like protein